MAYFAPYIDGTGIHMPTYEERLEALTEAYRGIFGAGAGLSAAAPDYQLLSVFARAAGAGPAAAPVRADPGGGGNGRFCPEQDPARAGKPGIRIERRDPGGGPVCGRSHGRPGVCE